ncbi:MAG: FAD:protein FMN transferase [Gammaproteobacteria bacterium]|nr:MAG: FAD:protein FMN transferase [Gammaproteobacteria bacterium]
MNVADCLKVFTLLLFTVLLIGGCEQKSATHSIFHKQIFVFGTTIDITIRHPNKKLVDQAFIRLEDDFNTMHATWHPWEPGPLTRTNQLLQTGEWFTAPSSVLPLITQAQDLAIRSEHYFNPAIGKLIRLWGFHRSDPENQDAVIERAELERLQSKLPQMTDIEIDGIKIRGKHPDLQVDLGGFAKGYGIDRGIEMLQGMGIQHAIINAGGDLRAIGKHPDRTWRIGVQHPRKNAVLATIETIRDESVFTSGDYRRYYMQEGKRRHHIIDPRTGQSVAHTIAVTVIHHNAAEADAAATALMVAGPENWWDTARNMGIRYVMLLAADGSIHMNPAMAKRLQLNIADQTKIKISKPLG